MPEKSISTRLRAQLDDMMGIYDKAVVENEPVLMEKLSKTCAGLAKQIQQHEAHERNTLRRDVAMQLAVQIGSAYGRAIKSQVKDEPVPLTRKLAYYIIELTNAEVLSMVEGFKDAS